MEPKQQKSVNASEKICERPINKEAISKEVSDYIVKQMKCDRKDTRHKITYIKN